MGIQEVEGLLVNRQQRAAGIPRYQTRFSRMTHVEAVRYIFFLESYYRIGTILCDLYQNYTIAAWHKM